MTQIKDVKRVNVNTANLKEINTNNIKVVNTDVNNSVNLNKYETKSIIDEIADFLGFEGARINKGYDLLKENGISCSKDDIKSVEQNGTDIIVSMKNGDKFTFKLEGDYFFWKNYKLSTITLSDGTVINCDLSDAEQSEIRDSVPGLVRYDAKIRGYATIYVDGVPTKVYWVGDDVDYQSFKSHLKDVQKAIKDYPKDVIDYIMDNARFSGFFIGTWGSTYLGDSFDDDTYASAYFDKYIYINANHSDSYGVDIIVHELGHILDYLLGTIYYDSNYDSFSYYDPKLEDLFLNYHDKIQKIKNGAYSNGVESEHEFFAQTISLYIEKPSELKKLFPDIYDYVEKLFDNIGDGKYDNKK